ncbi:MAG: ABC transporter permease [Xanthobacteraceae bacterium]
MHELTAIGQWTAAMLRSSTPLLVVTLGETLTQRVGIINLGVEGQMLGGACAGFAVAAVTGDPLIGFAAGAIAGAVLSAVHAGLCLACGANQIGSGIAVWTLGLGLTSYFGRAFIGGKVTGLAPLAGVSAADLPLFEPILTQLTPIAPVALLLVALVGLWLYRTSTGLNWRIVGESFETARAIGLAPLLVQLQGILVGGVLSGLAGAILSVDYTQTWANDMTKGRGFVAVGLVIVARWNPFLVLPVVLIFGLSEAATLRLQAGGLALSPYLIACLPYVVCLLCVIVASMREGSIGGMPAELASVFGRRR